MTLPICLASASPNGTIAFIKSISPLKAIGSLIVRASMRLLTALITVFITDVVASPNAINFLTIFCTNSIILALLSSLNPRMFSTPNISFNAFDILSLLFSIICAIPLTDLWKTTAHSLTTSNTPASPIAFLRSVVSF